MPILWNHLVNPIVNANAPADAVSGHGLGSTKSNGCRVNKVFFLEPFIWKINILFILILYKRGASS